VPLVVSMIGFAAVLIKSAELSYEELVVPYPPPPRLLRGIAPVNLLIDLGDASIALTDATPADCPNVVIRSGSSPKSEYFVGRNPKR